MKILEKDIERAIVDILTLDDWRCFKMEQQFSEKKTKLIGEKGMPDQLCIRYGFCQYTEEGPATRSVELMWIEVKRKGGQAGEHQKLWHLLERKRGALVLVAGYDFPASVDGFREFYKKSGLMRRKIIS